MIPSRFPRSRYALFLLTALAFLFLDLASKSWAFQHCGLPGTQEEWWVIPNVLGIQTSLNEGALFGMGQGFSFLFCGVSVLALAFFWGWLFGLGKAESRFWTFVLGMMGGGVLGNTFDRLGLHGLTWDWAFIPWLNGNPIHEAGEPVYAVRDWILVMLGSYHWPNFNLADSCMVVGISLILLDAFFHPEVAAGEAKKTPESPEQP